MAEAEPERPRARAGGRVADGGDLPPPLKADGARADDIVVYDGGQSHLARNPAADPGASSAGPSGHPQTSSFKFDLGSALARLAGEAPSDGPVTASADALQRPFDPPADDTHTAARQDRVAPDVGSAGAAPLDAGATGQASPPLPPAPSVAPAATPAAPAATPAAPAATPAAPAATPAAPAATPAAPAATPAAPVADASLPAPTPARDAEIDQVGTQAAADNAPQVDAPALPPTGAERDDRIAQRNPQSSVFEERVDPYDPSVRGQHRTTPPGTTDLVPVLPESSPAAPTSPVSDGGGADSRSDVTALRSAQMRASRQRHHGRLFGRLLLALVVGGGLIAAAMVFGRSLLFGTEWDADLMPIVNEIEAERGASFLGSVPVEVLDATEFGERYVASVIGDDWFDRIPEWRALGLAAGDVTSDSVRTELVADRRAYYDDRSGTILVLSGAGEFGGVVPDGPGAAAALAAAPDFDADLRFALETAFIAQRVAGRVDELGAVPVAGWVGLSSPSAVAERAVVHRVAGRSAERPGVNSALPAPIAYELAAVRTLGDPILVSSDLDPDQIVLGSDAPVAIGDPLDDEPLATIGALLRPGERSLADVVAVGTDDWSLVWGTHLPEETVARLVDLVAADSYLPIDRGGTTCTVGVFATVNEVQGDEVFSAMLDWASNAPAASSPAVSRLAPTRVQLTVCDPGRDAAVAPPAAVVDALIDRQQQRLVD